MNTTTPGLWSFGYKHFRLVDKRFGKGLDEEHRLHLSARKDRMISLKIVRHVDRDIVGVGEGGVAELTLINTL